MITTTTIETTSFTRRLCGGLLATGLVLTPVAATTLAPAFTQTQVAEAATGEHAAAAVAWAASQLGASEYYELCQAFVEDSYELGAGVDVGSAATAIDYWNSHPELQHPGDTNPPAGALVYWAGTEAYPEGHVALSEGGDSAISSYEGSDATIHRLSIAQRNTTHQYLGWILP